MASLLAVQKAFLQGGASDSEDNVATAKRRARAQNGRVTNSTLKESKLNTTMPRRASPAQGPTKRKAPPKQQNRQALKDRTNLQAASDTEEVDNFEDDEMDVGGGKPKAKRAKTTTSRKQPTSRAASEPTKSRSTKRAPAAELLGVIPETQPDPNDVSQSIEMDADNMDITTVPTPPAVSRFVQPPRSTSVQPLQPRASARSASAQVGYPPPRERSGSVSDTARERRGGDPESRRKLNDMTQKYENLNLKYQNLQAIGQNNAESNFEKLKRASDQKAKDANDLVASLKRELAELKKSSSSTTSETTGLQKQVTTLKATNDSLTTENTNLKESLQVSQNEGKSLEAKLVAARQQLSNSAATAAPDRPATRNNDLNRSIGPNSADVQKEAKMKENLYADLTGLIIRSVKRKEGEDEYDCIQTGRNGSECCFLVIIVNRITDVFRSSSLPSQHTERCQRHQPQDSLWPQLRRSGVLVRAFARRSQRQGDHGVAARLPDRGSLLPSQPRGEVLYESCGKHDEENYRRRVGWCALWCLVCVCALRWAPRRSLRRTKTGSAKATSTFVMRPCPTKESFGCFLRIPRVSLLQTMCCNANSSYSSRSATSFG